MRLTVRPFALLALASVTCAFTVSAYPSAQAQTARQQAPAAKQIALTEAQIEAVIATHKALANFTATSSPSPSSSVAQTNASVVAQLDALAKTNGFADYSAYNIALDNIGRVFAGVDAATKAYVGPAAVLKQKIAAVQADKTLSAEDREDARADLAASAKTPLPPVAHKGNIDLVIKQYDRLAPILRDE